MEEEIEDELKKKYKNLYIEVNWIDFRQYKIICKLPKTEETFDFTYTYNVNFTKDYNISIICYMIDKKILQYFKKEEIENAKY